ncbi:hypothetical protein ColTof4_14433 [Colletotrichum tofieldiae]|nr:hypothetical protein ColTof4_14433 [Colletotrichum tofieldiae]
MKGVLGKTLGAVGVEAVVLQCLYDRLLGEGRVVNLTAGPTKPKMARDTPIATSNDEFELGTHGSSVGIRAWEPGNEICKPILWGL